jgi:hypothetical protein
MTADIAEAVPAHKMFIFDSLKLLGIFERRIFLKEFITTREIIIRKRQIARK